MNLRQQGLTELTKDIRHLLVSSRPWGSTGGLESVPEESGARAGCQLQLGQPWSISRQSQLQCGLGQGIGVMLAIFLRGPRSSQGPKGRESSATREREELEDSFHGEGLHPRTRGQLLWHQFEGDNWGELQGRTSSRTSFPMGVQRVRCQTRGGDRMAIATGKISSLSCEGWKESKPGKGKGSCQVRELQERLEKVRQITRDNLEKSSQSEVEVQREHLKERIAGR